MPLNRDAVLILTHSQDHYTVDRVAEEVTLRGLRPLRIDTDGFPTELNLTTVLGHAGGEAMLRAGPHVLRAEEVQAVWLRRLVPPRLDESLDAEWRAGCTRESQAAFDGFLDALQATGARFINPVDAGRAAANKLRQLRLARELGLEVPRTLVTNEAARVREFFDQVNGHAVVKMLTALSQSMDGRKPFVYTRAVTREHLEHLDELRYSPMVFQERIDKARELRVVVVAGQCFVGAVDATKSEKGRVDWRRSAAGESPWQPGQLPQEVASRLVRLVSALGLVYGAADVIVTPEGRHVFLEVNPGGEWGMLERELGLPIASALAGALATGNGAQEQP